MQIRIIAAAIFMIKMLINQIMLNLFLIQLFLQIQIPVYPFLLAQHLPAML